MLDTCCFRLRFYATPLRRFRYFFISTLSLSHTTRFAAAFATLFAARRCQRYRLIILRRQLR